MSPKVSVIITTFNREELLQHAIKSVLGQTFRDFELIIVNDGSTDDTAAAIERFDDSRLVYVYQDNQGQCAARNRGVNHACGDYLAFLDDDDEFVHNKLELQLAALESNSRIELVAGGYYSIDEKGRVLGQVRSWEANPHPQVRDMFYWLPFMLPTILIRSEWWNRAGGMDPEAIACGDWDFLIRLSLNGGLQLEWVRQLVCRCRIHSGNVGRKSNLLTEYGLRILEKSFANPLMPPEILLEKNNIYAHYYLRVAGRAYGGGKLNNAMDDLAIAIRLNPRLLDRGGDQLREFFADFSSNPFIDCSPEAFLERVFGNLPPEAAAIRPL